MPTFSEIAEALIEIEQLKKKLGLIPKQRVVKVPAGTDLGRCEPGTKGRCFVCDQPYSAYDCIRRCCVTHPSGAVTGYRVCYKCSPYAYDWQLERYAINPTYWPYAWSSNQDSGTFGSKSVTNTNRVEELGAFYEDEELSLLDTKIKVLEGKLK